MTINTIKAMKDATMLEYASNCSTNAYGGTGLFFSLWFNLREQAFEIKKSKTYNTTAKKQKGNLIFIDQYHSDDLQRYGDVEQDDPIFARVIKRIGNFNRTGSVYC